MINLVSSAVVSFFIYAFFGWVWETAYCSYIEKRFERRGFLFGPICPIYGAGAMGAVLLLGWIGDPFLLFVAGATLATIIELITARALLISFGKRWWDYSHMPLNYKGYICAPATVLFGGFSVACVQIIQPAFMQVFAAVAPHTLSLVAASMLAVCSVDVLCSIERELGLALYLNGAKNRIMYELQNYMYSR
ncbi:MAG: putative ABC transporter permease [Atopobium sp.]|uniref:putative ABC transporter permease n=1 Tax=Atopobium sp. TaxID=1872650 RepID=UPI002A764F02|nr:putative ABC transporter permease [Atopobium sp.]MDY2789073.1 putative ABC transporter permease [Atopobium sp.]